jgi:hypothetical protein
MSSTHHLKWQSGILLLTDASLPTLSAAETPEIAPNPVGAAAGCDLLIWFCQKKSQKIVRTRPEPSSAPTGIESFRGHQETSYIK